MVKKKEQKNSSSYFGCFNFILLYDIVKSNL